MKKLLFWLAAIVILGSLEYVDYRNLKSIFELKQENRAIMTNNVNLIRLNEALSKGIGDVANSIIAKGEWDKKVATNIMQLNEKVNRLYEQTNQGF